MNVYILGDSKGLGKALKQKFQDTGYRVIGYSRTSGFDLEKNQELINQIEDNSLVILNSFLNGKQLDVFKILLKRPFIKAVICGSMSSRYFDNDNPEYSCAKQQLEKKFFDRAVYDPNKLLLLNLTGHAYQKTDLIFNTILFWLKNEDVIEVSFKRR